jgi:hypothetical protein
MSLTKSLTAATTSSLLSDGLGVNYSDQLPDGATLDVYYPLGSDLKDVVSGAEMTATGTAVTHTGTSTLIPSGADVQAPTYSDQLLPWNRDFTTPTNYAAGNGGSAVGDIITQAAAGNSNVSIAVTGSTVASGTYYYYVKAKAGTISQMDLGFYDDVSGVQKSGDITLTSEYVWYMFSATYGAGSTLRSVSIRNGTTAAAGTVIVADSILTTCEIRPVSLLTEGTARTTPEFVWPVNDYALYINIQDWQNIGSATAAIAVQNRDSPSNQWLLRNEVAAGGGISYFNAVSGVTKSVTASVSGNDSFDVVVNVDSTLGTTIETPYDSDTDVTMTNGVAIPQPITQLGNGTALANPTNCYISNFKTIPRPAGTTITLEQARKAV